MQVPLRGSSKLTNNTLVCDLSVLSAYFLSIDIMIITEYSFNPLPFSVSPSICTGCYTGSYGVNCREVKECQNGGVTNPVTGECQCNLGWTGEHCQFGKSMLT